MSAPTEGGGWRVIRVWIWVSRGINSGSHRITTNRGAYTKAGTGAVKLHPAAARLDVLRRDLIKALGQLGLQKPVPDEPEDNSPTLEDILAG